MNCLFVALFAALAVATQASGVGLGWGGLGGLNGLGGLGGLGLAGGHGLGWAGNGLGWAGNGLGWGGHGAGVAIAAVPVVNPWAHGGVGASGVTSGLGAAGPSGVVTGAGASGPSGVVNGHGAVGPTGPNGRGVVVAAAPALIAGHGAWGGLGLGLGKGHGW